MVVKYNTTDSTYLVYDEVEGWLHLEITENHERGCLEVTHYGREEVAVQTIFSPQVSLGVEIEKPADKAFERVVIRTGYDTVSWEHIDDPCLVQ